MTSSWHHSATQSLGYHHRRHRSCYFIDLLVPIRELDLFDQRRKHLSSLVSKIALDAALVNGKLNRGAVGPFVVAVAEQQQVADDLQQAELEEVGGGACLTTMKRF